MMRIALFLLTNLAVMVVFGLVLSLTGIQSSSVQGLLIMALLFGFGGSFVSLLMSKWMALKSVGGEVIEQPRNDMEQWLMNTVAQQSRQAGIAMPQVAIYHAPDINAFATGARRESVDVRGMVNRHLGHGDPGLTGLLSHRIHQPLFHIVTRLLNDFTTYRFQCHPFRHQK